MVALHKDESPYSLVRLLIQHYRLHDEGAPVDLSPLKEIFLPVPAVGPGMTDFVLMPKGEGPLTVLRRAHIIIADDDDLPWMVRYAHEVGHAVCRHTGTLRVLAVDSWFHKRQEREAWQLAALLLIPIQVIYDGGFSGWTKQHIASACGVPEWLVEMYPR